MCYETAVKVWKIIEKYRREIRDFSAARQYRWRVADRDRRISVKSGEDSVGRLVNQPAEDISESLSASGRSSYDDRRFKENLPCEALLL